MIALSATTKASETAAEKRMVEQLVAGVAVVAVVAMGDTDWETTASPVAAVTVSHAYSTVATN